jgi:hypothetical protein
MNLYRRRGGWIDIDVRGSRSACLSTHRARKVQILPWFEQESTAEARLRDFVILEIFMTFRSRRWRRRNANHVLSLESFF